MKIIVYDQDQRYVDTIVEELNYYKDRNMQLDIIGMVDIYELMNIVKRDQFDIAYLDIHIDSLKDVSIIDDLLINNCLIIFTTLYYQYIYDNFDERVFHYLYKPIEDQQFKVIYYKAIETYKKLQSIYFFNTSEGKKAFNPYTIYYLETYYHNLKIVSKEGSYYSNIKNAKYIKEILKTYDFIQIHQSFYINMNYIKQIYNDYLILENNTELPISINKKNQIKQEYKNFQIRNKIKMIKQCT